MSLLQGILGNDFQNCFWQWHHCLIKSIASQEEDFEGDCSRYRKGKEILHP
jgi:hypothetical protein